jgi:Domain of unknown function (DUF4124)
LKRLLLAAGCLLGAAVAQGQVYKCVDAHGVTQYSDKPRPECKGMEVDIHAQPPISGKLETPSTDLGAAEREFRKRQVQREREAREQAKADEARKRRCEQLKAEQRRTLSVRRPMIVDEKGERRYLDAAELDARVADLGAEIARTCP